MGSERTGSTVVVHGDSGVLFAFEERYPLTLSALSGEETYVWNRGELEVWLRVNIDATRWEFVASVVQSKRRVNIPFAALRPSYVVCEHNHYYQDGTDVWCIGPFPSRDAKFNTLVKHLLERRCQPFQLPTETPSRRTWLSDRCNAVDIEGWADTIPDNVDENFTVVQLVQEQIARFEDNMMLYNPNDRKEQKLYVRWKQHADELIDLVDDLDIPLTFRIKSLQNRYRQNVRAVAQRSI